MLPRIELAAGRTRSWLATLLETRVPLSLASHFDLIGLADLCTSSSDDDVSFEFFRSACLNLAQLLDSQSPANAFKALLGTDARRVLLAYRAFLRGEMRCHCLEDFIGGLASSLAQADPKQTDVAEASHLCRISGLLAADLVEEGDALELPPVIELLSADEPTIQRIIDDVARACHFGLDRSGIHSGAREILLAVIPAWILDFARNYRLASLASALRILVYVGGIEPEVTEDAVRFLLDQQNPSGWFGFFGPELARIRNKGRPFDANSELYLPTTLACHWALIESASQYRFLAPRTGPSDRLANEACL